MIRIILFVLATLPKRKQAEVMDEYTQTALKADAIQIGKRNETVTVTFMDSTDKTAALLKKAYRDENIERVNTDTI